MHSMKSISVHHRLSKRVVALQKSHPSANAFHTVCTACDALIGCFGEIKSSWFVVEEPFLSSCALGRRLVVLPLCISERTLLDEENSSSLIMYVVIVCCLILSFSTVFVIAMFICVFEMCVCDCDAFETVPSASCICHCDVCYCKL